MGRRLGGSAIIVTLFTLFGLALLAFNAQTGRAETRSVQLRNGEVVYGTVTARVENGQVTAIVVNTVGGERLTFRPDEVMSTESMSAPAGRNRAAAREANPAPASPYRRGEPNPPSAPSDSGGGLGAVPDMTQAQIKGLQAVITTDPALMKDIMSLAMDPEIAALVQNPELMRLIMAGDVNAASKNPNFQRLARDPRIVKLMNRVKQRSGAQRR